MTTTYTSNIALGKPGYRDSAWHSVLNANLNSIDSLVAGEGSIAISSTTVSPTVAQLEYATIKFTGTLTGNTTVTLPRAGIWVVKNSTSGNYVLIVEGSASGGSVVIPQGGAPVLLQGDGTDATLATGGLGAGDIVWSGASAKPGFLICNGAAVSRTVYAALFAAISTTFGVGDGSTTFNIPDLRGRAAFGKDNMGGSAANRLLSTGIDGTVTSPDGSTLGATGGAYRKLLNRIAARTPIGTGGAVEALVTFDGISVELDGGYSGGNVYTSSIPPAIVLNAFVKY